MDKRYKQNQLSAVSLTIVLSDVCLVCEINDRSSSVAVQQVSDTNGLLYVVTKYAHLYLCDVETATCLCSVSMSSHIVFTTAVSSRTGGLLCINTAGQVLFVLNNRCYRGGGGTTGWAGPWPTQNFGWVGHNAFGPTNNWPVCSLILRKLVKLVPPDVRF